MSVLISDDEYKWLCDFARKHIYEIPRQTIEDAIAEIALRKLNYLGIVKKAGMHLIYDINEKVEEIQ